MSVRQRFPLTKLILLREHRTEAARMALLEKQRETQACRDQCTQIEGEIESLGRDRSHHRAQLMAPPPPGTPWPMALEQRERHIEHLADMATAARTRLATAKEALQKAEQAQEQARVAYFRARARQEALEKRRDVWDREQRIAQARREESAADELMMGRRSPIIPS